MANKVAVKAFSLLLVVLMAGSAVMMLSGGLTGGGGQESTIKPVEGAGVVMDNGSRLFQNLPIPAIGPADARLQVYIFYSLFCPHCGNEVRNNLDYYVSLAKEGVARIYFVDFPQTGAQNLHAGLRCIARNGGPFLEVLQDLYAIILDEGRLPTMEDLRDIASRYNASIDEACINEELPIISNIVTISYSSYKVSGTPTIVVYDTVTDKGYMAVGEQSREELEKFINDVLSGSAG
ncbi:MAG: thioredoxin domain-containing protein [Desulfurococcales archaeon]|nr:thioredoxin domain-containing protein [Desulfurococcales archaeon]